MGDDAVVEIREAAVSVDADCFDVEGRRPAPGLMGAVAEVVGRQAILDIVARGREMTRRVLRQQPAAGFNQSGMEPIVLVGA